MAKIVFLQPLDGWAVPNKVYVYQDKQWILNQKTKPGKTFKPFEINVSSLKQFKDELTVAWDKRLFMISGQLIHENISDPEKIRRLKKEKGGNPPTIKPGPMAILPLDIDDYEDGMDPSNPKARVENYISKELPPEFAEADYIYQTSASYGLKGDDLRVHIFFYLSEPVVNSQAISWAKGIDSLDKSPLECYQPIYTQKRTVIGVDDPYPPEMGLVEKNGPLCFSFPDPPEESEECGNLEQFMDGDSLTISERLACIVGCKKGPSGQSVHSMIRDWRMAEVKDTSRSFNEIKSTFIGMTSHWEVMGVDKTHLDYISDFDRQLKDDFDTYRIPVDSAKVEEKWGVEEATGGRIFTNIPNQGGMMEELIQYFTKSMRFPNRQIATMTALATISTLGGNVYYNEATGGGICLSIQGTGRSSIGKDFIKQGFLQFVDEPDNLVKNSINYIGSGYYKSAKKLVEDIVEKSSLLAILTESGQQGLSKAGDVGGYKAVLLNILTNSGPGGFVQKGGQNDEVPALYSPSITMVKESVAEIQKMADLMSMADSSGELGRFMYYIINSKKSYFNRQFSENHMTPKLKKLRDQLLLESTRSNRIDSTQPRSEDSWIVIRSEDPEYLFSRFNDWTDAENEFHDIDNKMLASTWGRLYQRVPSYASLLAICENPSSPLITRKMIDIAEESCIAQFEAYNKQEESGEADTGWLQIINRVKKLFKGNMAMNKTLRKKSSREMLNAGCCTWSSIAIALSPYSSYKQLKAQDGAFKHHLNQHLEQEGILLLSKSKAYEKFSTKADVYMRVG